MTPTIAALIVTSPLILFCAGVALMEIINWLDFRASERRRARGWVD